MKTDGGETLAAAVYRRARSHYHPITQTTIDKILGRS
jgi:hypothetical protein